MAQSLSGSVELMYEGRVARRCLRIARLTSCPTRSPTRNGPIASPKVSIARSTCSGVAPSSTRYQACLVYRSEERRVGKEGRSRWALEYHKKNESREMSTGYSTHTVEL